MGIRCMDGARRPRRAVWISDWVQHSRYRNEPHRGGAETQTAKPQPGERKRQTERRKRVSRRGKRFFRSEPSEVSKGLRMSFLDQKRTAAGERERSRFIAVCSLFLGRDSAAS